MRRASRGFTLVEALVALALFALTALVGYRGLSALLDGRRHLETEEARWKGLDRVFGLLRSDLEASVDRPVRNNFGVEEAAFSADFDAGAAQDAAVWWTRTGAPGSGDEPAAPQRVGWRLREQRIERLRWPAPDRGPRSEPEVLAVLDGVSTWSLRYLGQTASGPVWDTRWQKPAHLSLPRAVEVSIDLRDGRHLVRTFDLPAAP
jgi:general secretion pathway protein J